MYVGVEKCYRNEGDGASRTSRPKAQPDVDHDIQIVALKRAIADVAARNVPEASHRIG
jgi:hypothetical protein